MAFHPSRSVTQPARATRSVRDLLRAGRPWHGAV